MITVDSNKKFVLCITDAFTKYAVVTAIANKDAEMVADAIYRDWFAKFGIPAQVHTPTAAKTSPAHPQCKAQVEVFNKRVKMFLQSFVDDTTLNWETYLPALAISYNTSYSFYDSNNSILEKKHHYLPFQMGISSKFTTAAEKQKDSICYRSTSIRHRTRTKIQKQF
jgi:hypothetical protein